MNKLILSLLFCIAGFTGCTTSTPLDEKWLPLTEIVDRPGSDSWITTIGTKIYYAKVDEYLKKNPPGSIRFDSLLYHEQIHSKRQLDYGVKAWLFRYSHDTGFMWREEQLGWYAEILHRRSRGEVLYPEALAKTLSGYRNPVFQQMVSYEDALQWVHDVFSGVWRPDADDLWSLPDFAR